ncbi:hypothetical protein GE09DRAFT_1212355 [Coniochaeta sp. 2T2.1]|nr:hypothetical protein GE09DRAFT_1212355 [Coniochaeta sp. 2T2.1]
MQPPSTIVKTPLFPPPDDTTILPLSSSADSVRGMAVALLYSSSAPDSEQDAIFPSFLAQRQPSPAIIAQAAHLVEYHIATMDLVDLFVERLKLPRPGGGQMCAAWTPAACLTATPVVSRSSLPPTPPSSPEGGGERSNSGSSPRRKKKTEVKYSQTGRFDQLVLMLRTHGFDRLLPSHHECLFECCGHHVFERPVHYMAACLEMTCVEVDEVTQFIAHLSAVMAFYDDEGVVSNMDTRIGVTRRLASAKDVSKRELGIRKRGLRGVIGKVVGAV